MSLRSRLFGWFRPPTPSALHEEPPWCPRCKYTRMSKIQWIRGNSFYWGCDSCYKVVFCDDKNMEK